MMDDVKKRMYMMMVNVGGLSGGMGDEGLGIDLYGLRADLRAQRAVF